MDQHPTYPSHQPTGVNPLGIDPMTIATVEKNWAVGSHLSAFVPALLSAVTMLPGWSVLGPLLMMLVTKDKPFAQRAAKDALNFEITWSIASVIAAITIIGLPLVPVIAIGMVVCHVRGAIKASQGERYAYPWTLRLVS